MNTVTHNNNKYEIYTWETILNFDGYTISLADCYNQNFIDGKHQRITAEQFATGNITDEHNYMNVACESFFRFSVKMHKNILITTTGRKSYDHTRRDALAFIAEVNGEVIFCNTFAEMKVAINAALKAGK